MPFVLWTRHFLGSESINTLLLAASALGRDPQLFEGRKVFALSWVQSVSLDALSLDWSCFGFLPFHNRPAIPVGNGRYQDQLHQLVMSKGGVVVPFWSARGLSKWLQSNGNVSWHSLAQPAHVETQTSQNDRSDQGDWRTRHFFVGGWGGWGGWGWIFCHFCPKNSLKQVDANCHHLWSINYHGHFFGLVSDWKWTTLTAICSAEVPYVMLADLSVLDMSVRSTTLHHRTDMVNMLEGFLRCF